MNRSFIGALCLSAALALLAACGGSQPPIAAPGAIPMAQITMHHDTSSKGDLLYISTRTKVLMVSYPEGKVVGTLPAPSVTPLLCSDPDNGNVFVGAGSKIVEYAHGGTTPIATLELPTGFTRFGGCSIDPTTGNLGVGVGVSAKTCGVLVYANAEGSPSFYTAKHLRYCDYTAYDGSGNLFLGATTSSFRSVLMELPQGETALARVSGVEADLCLYSCAVQWDGQYLVTRPYNASLLTQIAISGTSGTVIGRIYLTSNADTYAFYIKGNSVISIDSKVRKHNNEAIGVWAYPAGGAPTAQLYNITQGRKNSLGFLTYSVAPSRSRVHKQGMTIKPTFYSLNGLHRLQRAVFSARAIAPATPHR